MASLITSVINFGLLLALAIFIFTKKAKLPTGGGNGKERKG
jgi:large-conductance mechanosensitive channel